MARKLVGKGIGKSCMILAIPFAVSNYKMLAYRGEGMYTMCAKIIIHTLLCVKIHIHTLLCTKLFFTHFQKYPHFFLVLAGIINTMCE